MLLALFVMVYGIFFNEGDKKYTFDHLNYNVQILSDGDAVVLENRTYTYRSGEFTRGYFELENGVEDIVVLENGQQYKLIPNFDEKRPEGTYAFKKQGTVTRVEWYMKAAGGQNRTFTIRYKVKKAAVLYNDCAVYFQKFLSEKNTAEIKKISVQVKLPSGANAQNTLIWGHGPLDGNIQFENPTSNIVKLQVKDIPEKNYVEARFVMDRNLMTESKYIVNTNIRDNIIKEETEAKNQAYKNRKITGISTLVAYGIAIVLVILPIVMRIKKREHFTKFTPELTPEYYREIPENIPPAILDKIFNYYSKKENVSTQISGTLIDMIYRKIIVVSHKQNGRKTETFLSVSKKSFKSNEVTAFERSLIKFIFTHISQGKDLVSMKEIKKFCKQKRNAKHISQMLSSYKFNLESMWEKYDFVENKKNVVPKIFIVLIIANLLILIVSFSLFSAGKTPLFGGAYIVLMVGAFLGFIITIISSKSKRMLNQRGENKLALWKGFYKFLNNLTLMDEKELPELFMWEKYLVYATVLGVAEKVLKVLRIRYPQFNDQYFENNNMTLLYSLPYTDMSSVEGFKDFTASIESAVRDAQNVVSNMSSSSSNDSGSGFSSGGDSGGSGSGGSTGGGMD